MSPFTRFAALALLVASTPVSADADPPPPPGAWPAAPPASRPAELGGRLIVTDDPDWADEWNTPEEYAPRFRTTERVAPGGRLHILTVFHGPTPRADGRADIRCDFRLTRPDGDVAMDERDVPCFAHPVAGKERTIFMVDQALVFVADENEPQGEFTIDVVLHDAVAGTRKALSARFLKEAP